MKPDEFIYAVNGRITHNIIHSLFNFRTLKHYYVYLAPDNDNPLSVNSASFQYAEDRRNLSRFIAIEYHSYITMGLGQITP